MDRNLIPARLKAEVSRIEDFLALCPAAESAPAKLREAMEYSLLAGGKRLRPILCLSFVRLFGGDEDAALPFAAALECIHSYSLIHDDLPAMDDDDLRRGKPSNHKMFGEAAAILAGDALLSDAFSLMASCGRKLPAERVLRAIGEVSRAIGSAGMAGGQFLDIAYTGTKAVTLAELRAMHALKTGALLRASCLCGAVLAGAGERDLSRAAAYGAALGAAFQIMDDVLDETGDTDLLGKPVGSDAQKGKATYPSLLGLARSRELAGLEKDAAAAALATYAGNPEAAFLLGLAAYVLEREQ